MKFLNSKKVLCVGAHPDDVEYGMAGTFSKCTDTDFIVLVMSDGGDFDKTTTYEDRIEENKNVWDVFENVNGIVNNQDFVKNQSEDEMINFIETTFNGFDLVVTAPQQDSHFEHRMINNLGPALCRRSPITLVEYRTPSTLDSWSPNTFTNITEYFNEKQKQLMLFKSQKDRWYFQEDLLKSFHSNFQSYKKGIKYVEKFKTVQFYDRD